MQILEMPLVGKKRAKAARKYVDFGAKLKARREDLAISQAELSRKANVHAVTISRLEGGFIDPSLSMLETLSSALGCTVSELLGG